jgi:phenylacetate-CoA ligase
MGFFLQDEEGLDAASIQALQEKKLREVFEEIITAEDSYYHDRLNLRSAEGGLEGLLTSIPLTSRSDLEADQIDCPPYGRKLTRDISNYSRFHQTSGTSSGGAGVGPLRCPDTAEAWAWWKRCWSIVFRGAGVREGDRLVFPFSFGPFVGFWSAFEAGVSLGHLSLPAGGMTTRARLNYLLDNEATVICCTPTYGLRMAEVAGEEGLNIESSSVRLLIVAGEPGGNVPAVRRRLEGFWGARVIDHAGMTEVGPWGFECEERPGGMHVIESEFIAEVIDPVTGRAIPDGEPGELVLTNLGRVGLPVLRYRTGDEVMLIRERCPCGRWFAWAKGGVRGRIDDMLVIRGNNVFPSSVENVLREFDEISEFRMSVQEIGTLRDLVLEIEPNRGAKSSDLIARVSEVVRDRLHFRPKVTLVEAGTLPRHEMKRPKVRVTNHLNGASQQGS